MSLYVLDTDTISLAEKGHSTVCQNLTHHPPTDLAIGVVTVEEQLS